jgi:hypothetical protein
MDKFKVYYFESCKDKSDTITVAATTDKEASELLEIVFEIPLEPVKNELIH